METDKRIKYALYQEIVKEARKVIDLLGHDIVLVCTDWRKDYDRPIPRANQCDNNESL